MRRPRSSSMACTRSSAIRDSLDFKKSAFRPPHRRHLLQIGAPVRNSTVQHPTGHYRHHTQAHKWPDLLDQPSLTPTISKRTTDDARPTTSPFLPHNNAARRSETAFYKAREMPTYMSCLCLDRPQMCHSTTNSVILSDSPCPLFTCTKQPAYVRYARGGQFFLGDLQDRSLRCIMSREARYAL